MVNTGQPSNACFQCRDRRIKCDATRPQCYRCIKYGVICPGYPERGQITFRDDSERVRARAFRKYQTSRKTQQGADLLDVPQASSGNTSESSCASSSLGPPQAAAWFQSRRQGAYAMARSSGFGLVQGAVAAFLSQWSIPDVDVFWGALDTAVVLYPSSKPGSCFGAALEATSILILTLPRASHNLDIRRSAMNAYGNALSSINKALDDPKQRLSDHTLMAVFLICLFETLNETETRVERARIHMFGIMKMIGMRGTRQFNHSVGRRLFLAACLLWNIGTIPLPQPYLPPLPDDICNVLLNAKLGQHEQSYRLIPVAHRSTALRGLALQTLQAKPHPDNETVLACLSQVMVMDKELLQWYNNLPEDWAKREHLYELLTLNIFRAHRVFLQDLALKCYQCLRSPDYSAHDAEMARHVSESKDLVDQMCASIPYSFGSDNPGARTEDVDAAIMPDTEVDTLYHMSFSFPLLVCSMVECLPQKQKDGIEAARRTCAQCVGLQTPMRTFPRVLINVESPTATVPE